MVAEERTDHGLATDFEELFCIPPVSAHQRRSDALVSGLLCEQRDVAVITRDENHIGIRAFDRGNLRIEILIACLIGLSHDHLSTELGEGLADELLESGGIIVLAIYHNCGPLGVERARRELRD